MTSKSIRHAGSTLRILNRGRKYLKSILSEKSREENITYEGVYKNFIDARTSQVNVTGYMSEKWLDIEIVKLEEVIEKYQINPQIDGNYRDRDLLLVIAGMNVKELKILDIGSGFANTFFYLKSNFRKHIDYIAVDLSDIVLALNQRIRDYGNFKACTLDAVPSEKYDLIYFGSSLQYIEAYENHLIQICELKAPVIFISDTPMGDANTFVTVQVNMEGRRIPRWVFSKIEVISLLENYGYTLVAESLVDWHQKIHNFDNFPTNYHQTRNYNLLFEYKS
jgi:putative methyltransferase (TIGR04325 family)